MDKMGFNLTKTQLDFVVLAALLILALLALPCIKAKWDERKKAKLAAQAPRVTAEELAARGTDRALGYGSKYHIVGEKAYACDNDWKEMLHMPCGVDDYSIWQDGEHQDHVTNPTYGYATDADGTCGGTRVHEEAQNPYDDRDVRGCGSF